MAEGRTADLTNVVCRFFATSTCRDGDKCLFSHDMTRPIHDNVCRFYLQGRCLFGNFCRYDHVQVINPECHEESELIKCPSSSKKDNRTSSQVQLPKHQPHTKQCIRNETTKHEPSREANSTSPASPVPVDWVNAPVFIPKTSKSYADALKIDGAVEDDSHPVPENSEELSLCPYFIMGECPYNEDCGLAHGELCELCGKACLHPYNKEQRKNHVEQCEKEFVKDMELSFAIQRSADKTCGICFDTIMEKSPPSERRFGILEKCNHVFCLSCIRKWRQAKRVENSHPQHIDNVLDPVVTRACPECRKPSDFITPSVYWVETEEEKSKLITEYKAALSKKPCKYFQQGRGECPFAGACFYLHAYPDGTKAELPPPRRRRRQNQNGDLDFMERIFLWDYLEFRDENILLQFDPDEIYDFSDTESDDSDMSASDLFTESV